MSDPIIMKKLESIELLLKQMNTKLDNFLGLEELSEEEIAEIQEIREDMKKGNYSTFAEVFED